MTYEQLENCLLQNFKLCKYRNYITINEQNSLSRLTLLKPDIIKEAYRIYQSDTEFSNHEWVKLLLPLADKRQVYHSKKLDLDFIVLDDGTTVFKDFAIYLPDEVEKMRGLEDEERRKVHNAKLVFKGIIEI